MLDKQHHSGYGNGSTVAAGETPVSGRQLVQALQGVLADRQRLVLDLRRASLSGAAEAVDLAEGLARLTARHDALLDQLARTVPPAGAPHGRGRPAA